MLHCRGPATDSYIGCVHLVRDIRLWIPKKAGGVFDRGRQLSPRTASAMLLSGCTQVVPKSANLCTLVVNSDIKAPYRGRHCVAN